MTEDQKTEQARSEARAESWISEAKKLAEAGQDQESLALYCRAADDLPGAPWLQHRTAELARKLKRNDVAIVYFRKAAGAFELAHFTKRAVPPLRTAWSLALDGLPHTSSSFVELSRDLVQLHKRLGFAADASVTFERSNAALRAKGFSSLPQSVLEGARSEPPRAPSSPPRPLMSADRAPRANGAPSRLGDLDPAPVRMLKQK